MRFVPSLAINLSPRTRAFSSSSARQSHLVVINAGSSSLKYSLFGLKADGVDAAVFTGLVELSTANSRHGRIVHKALTSGEKEEIEMPLDTHRTALETVVDKFFGSDLSSIKAVGHRVVHGGEAFSRASLVDDRVIDAIKQNTKLAPLHNPGNLLGIEVATEVFGPCPQVVVFDTAFHATMPPKAYTYGLPMKLYEDFGVRRYGFHGTSHQYVTKKAAALLGKAVEECNFITCHLGNGSSIAAIRNGQCIDTSMGMTPLEGLVMGTRCGDVDPALHAFLCKELDMTIQEVNTMLNKKSGLLGICGESDIRAIQDRVRIGSDQAASLALDVFAHRVRKFVGAYALELGGDVDALIFTAGIGENSASIRERVCHDLGFLGIEINGAKNAASTMGSGPVEIQADNAKTKVMVVNTDEERSIAEQTYEITLEQFDALAN
uniref:Probable acetate kinase n=1 Tax=Peronospora matthiolae TaxID=2874970 RepID=A0AAV1TX38_9STRA